MRTLGRTTHLRSILPFYSIGIEDNDVIEPIGEGYSRKVLGGRRNKVHDEIHRIVMHGKSEKDIYSLRQEIEERYRCNLSRQFFSLGKMCPHTPFIA
ncbi:hypothetical protein SAY86_020183 [Trapa natans]|uniref:Uncharacterized protein n=1 Tax=Trapa natans TaxID=22666 RepID=A0AAN7LQ58_TRANT|nr:hypothetical protein SAY86_020183 [Trapa natans]